MKFLILFAACYTFNINLTKYAACICTVTGENSIITGPMKLRSYYAVASYSDQKSKFSFSEGTLLQLLQKDSSGK